MKLRMRKRLRVNLQSKSDLRVWVKCPKKRKQLVYHSFTLACYSKTQQHRHVDKNCHCVIFFPAIFVTPCDVFVLNTTRKYTERRFFASCLLDNVHRVLSRTPFLPIFNYYFLSLCKAALLSHMPAAFQTHIQLIWPLFLTLRCKFGPQ